MTNEQWLIYIYGIYPEGGFTAALWTMVIFMVLSLLTILQIDKPEIMKIWKSIMKPLVIVTFISSLIGYFIPTKNAYLLMLATPSVVNSMENGKLSKLEKLIGRALDEAGKSLDKVEDNEQ